MCAFVAEVYVIVHRWRVWEDWSCRWVQDIQCNDESDLVIASRLLHQTNRPRWC